MLALAFVFSLVEPSRSTTRNIWSTPAPLKTSTWSKTSSHDNPFLSTVCQVRQQRTLSVFFFFQHHCRILFLSYSNTDSHFYNMLATSLITITSFFYDLNGLIASVFYFFIILNYDAERLFI